ncbi:hypothetical protein JTE90_025532 [Oedothorax gibbosus]|uniref:BEN domain-containing protein n=1 Tax=Oedothorax gibbosus TaxID=931172 RepID=A0AAV6TWD7_9ARAC|nr:hypothetical protein JTE90_025532 [Oedothorax gibbosus]
MRWAHVRFHLDNKKVNVPINFIENFESLDLVPFKKYNVFWSNNPNDSPETILQKERQILYIEKIKRTTSKNRPTIGWYIATLLLLADSEELIESVEETRVKVKPIEIEQDDKSQEPTASVVNKKAMSNKVKNNHLRNLFGEKMDNFMEPPCKCQKLDEKVSELEKALAEEREKNKKLSKFNWTLQEMLQKKRENCTEGKKVNDVNVNTNVVTVLAPPSPASPVLEESVESVINEEFSFQSESASPAKTQVTASAATGYDESYNLAGPSNPKQDDNQFKRAYMDFYCYQGSYTDVPQKRVKSDKKAQVNTSSKGKKRQRTFDADESTIHVKSFKRFALEAVAKSLGDVNFENSSDGSKVPIALRCLGFKRIPDIIEESSGPRRSRRLKNKY